MDLQSVLSFMYVGEVNVGQQDLTAFLAVAEDLQVKGGGNAAYWQVLRSRLLFWRLRTYDVLEPMPASAKMGRLRVQAKKSVSTRLRLRRQTLKFIINYL